jgi:hypothetical protein
MNGFGASHALWTCGEAIAARFDYMEFYTTYAAATSRSAAPNQFQFLQDQVTSQHEHQMADFF